MKNILLSTTLVTLVLFTGCSYKASKTPVAMTYDGSKLDYSQVKYMKQATICQKLTNGDGDTTIITAAEKAGIKNVKHVDTSFNYEKFLFIQYGHKRCVTVYGE